MALDSTQRRIINSLLDKPQTIRQLTISTGLSDSTVRQTLKLLHKLHEVTMDASRQPYLYEVGLNSNEYRNRTAVDNVKETIRGTREGQNIFTKSIAKVPKEQLTEWVPIFRAMADAIEEMYEDNELLDTL